MTASKTNQSAAKVLSVLKVLLQHFVHGLTPTELTKATGLTASNITRYVDTLIEAGFAERIPATGRIRASHTIAQHAVMIMKQMQQAEAQLKESMQRITTEI